MNLNALKTGQQYPRPHPVTRVFYSRLRFGNWTLPLPHNLIQQDAEQLDQPVAETSRLSGGEQHGADEANNGWSVDREAAAAKNEPFSPGRRPVTAPSNYLRTATGRKRSRDHGDDNQGANKRWEADANAWRNSDACGWSSSDAHKWRDDEDDNKWDRETGGGGCSGHLLAAHAGVITAVQHLRLQNGSLLARPNDDALRLSNSKSRSKRSASETPRSADMPAHRGHPLAIGNVEVHHRPSSNEDAAVVRNTDVCEIVADFLCIRAHDLGAAVAQDEVVKELCTALLDPDGAADN
ncbi:Glycosyltransferase family 2 protein [Mycena chlorophos]|uniref:Glycosyltransferase family 2 protein n=1 Tax=Mycena chlorophos TaxID=658473 RepID=A0A8H6RUV1_MYCCL|nr:Glycosyltransferase family 2 protein [Mycena chlorophos]